MSTAQVLPASSLKAHSFRNDLEEAVSKCVFHVRRASTLTPRKDGLSTCGTHMLSIFSVRRVSGKSVACALLQLISMHRSFDRELTLLAVSCMTYAALGVCSVEVQAARSSACREFVTLSGRVLTMSFTHKRNRVGERTLPCGTH